MAQNHYVLKTIEQQISVREAARRLGVSHTAVQKRVIRGTLSTLPGGKLDWERLQKEWRSNRDESKVRKAVLMKTDRERATSASGISAFAEADRDLSTPGQSYADAKTQREYLRLANETLERKKLQSELVDAAEVRVAILRRAY